MYRVTMNMILMGDGSVLFVVVFIINNIQLKMNFLSVAIKPRQSECED